MNDLKEMDIFYQKLQAYINTPDKKNKINTLLRTMCIQIFYTFLKKKIIIYQLNSDIEQNKLFDLLKQDQHILFMI